MGFSGDEQDKQLAQELTLRAVELGLSPALGGDVRLELAPRTTVLVGKNGAGKSAILERISEGCQNVWGVAKSPRPDPGRLACEFQLHDRSLRYQCTWHPRGESVREKITDLELARIEETCTLAEPEELLWSVDDGVLVRNDGTTSEISPGRTLVNAIISMRRKFTFPNSAGFLFEWFSSICHLRTAIAREREEVMTPIRPIKQLQPLQVLALQIVKWQTARPAEFAEFVELGRRNELFHDVVIKRYIDPDGDSLRPEARKDFVSVVVDGVDLGLLSDGTLRAMRILLALVDPENRFVLIDEPETAVHPGLLSGLLHEIEAYSIDRQIVLATQSPQVVSWAQPQAIRLVERKAGVTNVRSLDEHTVSQLERYLHNGDTLGDFIYGGGVDGFA